MTLPEQVTLTLTTPKDSLSKTQGSLLDGYTLCGARTLTLVDLSTSELINPAMQSSELVTFINGVLKFLLQEVGTYSYLMRYSLDGFPSIESLPKVITIIV